MFAKFALTLLAAALASGEVLTEKPIDIFRRSSELQRIGKLQEAEQLIRSLVNDASLTASSKVVALNELGLILIAEMKHDDAEKHLRKAIEMANQLPDLKPIYHIRARMNLCALYLETSRLQKAEGQISQIVPSDLVTSADHSQLTSLRAAIALLKDDNHRAIQIYEQHLSQLRSASPERDVRVDIGTTLNNLGTAAVRARAYSRAAEYLNEALVIWRSLIPAEQTGFLRTLINLAVCREQQKDYASARALLAESIDVARPILGEDNILTAAIYAEYSGVLAKLGRKQESKTFKAMAKRSGEQAPPGRAKGQVIDISELSSFRSGNVPGIPVR